MVKVEIVLVIVVDFDCMKMLGNVTGIMVEVDLNLGLVVYRIVEPEVATVVEGFGVETSEETNIVLGEVEADLVGS